MLFERLAFLILNLQSFLENGTDDVVNRTSAYDNPFMYLHAARWFEIYRHSPFSFTDCVSQIGGYENTLYVASDHALAHENMFIDGELEKLHSKGSAVLPFRCAKVGRPEGLTGILNQFDCRRYQELKTPSFDYGTQTTANDPHFVNVPLGCPSNWLAPNDTYSRSVFLDEPHGLVIENFANKDILSVKCFIHALNVCQVLHYSFGFEIVIFSRTSRMFIESLRNTYPFLRVVEHDGWMPFSKLIREYSKSSLFYSHFQETNGYGIFENLQLGNGIICYSENLDESIVRNFQLGARLSVFMPEDICANIVNAFFVRLVSKELKSTIREESNHKYSAETFATRLVRALGQCGILFSSLHPSFLETEKTPEELSDVFVQPPSLVRDYKLA